MVREVTIIGAGPAGIACAIQLKRWGLDPLVLEGDHIGGLLLNANLVENYPGFPEGIRGADLVRLFARQLERTGVRVEYQRVLELDFERDFRIRTPDREVVSRFVVVASGTEPRPIERPRIPKDISGRVFQEVYPIADCHAKTIAIVGAGDAAFDYALNLCRSNAVTLLNRGSERKCLPLLWERASSAQGIDYRENTCVEGVRADGEGAVLECSSPAGECELRADYVIFAIGRRPRLDFLSARLEGCVPELEAEGRLHFVGDVANGIYRQTAIAVGDGVRAATGICEKVWGVDS